MTVAPHAVTVIISIDTNFFTAVNRAFKQSAPACISRIKNGSESAGQENCEPFPQSFDSLVPSTILHKKAKGHCSPVCSLQPLHPAAESPLLHLHTPLFFSYYTRKPEKKQYAVRNYINYHKCRSVFLYAMPSIFRNCFTAANDCNDSADNGLSCNISQEFAVFPLGKMLDKPLLFLL